MSSKPDRQLRSTLLIGEDSQSVVRLSLHEQDVLSSSSNRRKVAQVREHHRHLPSKLAPGVQSQREAYKPKGDSGPAIQKCQHYRSLHVEAVQENVQLWLYILA